MQLPASVPLPPSFPLLFCLSCTSAVWPIRGFGGGRAPQIHHSREELLHLPRSVRELIAEGGDKVEPSLRLYLRVHARARVCVCSSAADTAAAAAAADFSFSRRRSRLLRQLLWHREDPCGGNSNDRSPSSSAVVWFGLGVPDSCPRTYRQNDRCSASGLLLHRAEG